MKIKKISAAEMWQLAAHNQGVGYEEAAREIERQEKETDFLIQESGFCNCGGSQNVNEDKVCHNCGGLV